MSYKKHWAKQEGVTPIFKKENSNLSMIEVTMVRLKAKETATFAKEATEYAVIILGGTCDVVGEGFSFPELGKRKNVFDGPATALYLPRNKSFSITAKTDVQAVVCLCPAEEAFEPALVRPEDVIIKDLGKNGWQRQAHFIIDERIKANLIYVGEAYVKSGMWASYPPHKHDEDNMPTEGFLEEVYYYEFDKESGFGIQKVYTKDRSVDETYTVETGDIVEIPKGYHPFACAPGYDAYYLWIMAGKNRGFFMTTEEGHKWLIQ